MPAPPPPPPPSFSAPPSSSGRNALLSQIQKGAKLKKTETNDRSSPLVSTGGSSSANALANSIAIDSAKAGHVKSEIRPSASLGGLFAGGVPKLKPTSKSDEKLASASDPSPKTFLPFPSQSGRTSQSIPLQSPSSYTILSTAPELPSRSVNQHQVDAVPKLSVASRPAPPALPSRGKESTTAPGNRPCAPPPPPRGSKTSISYTEPFKTSVPRPPPPPHTQQPTEPKRTESTTFERWSFHAVHELPSPPEFVIFPKNYVSGAICGSSLRSSFSRVDALATPTKGPPPPPPPRR